MTMAMCMCTVAAPLFAVSLFGKNKMLSHAFDAACGTLVAAWVIHALVFLWSNSSAVTAFPAGYFFAILDALRGLPRLWAGSEGSFFLYICLFAVFSLVLRPHSGTRRASALLFCAYLAVLLLFLNPFYAALAPERPLLSPIWMSIHPLLTIAAYAAASLLYCELFDRSRTRTLLITLFFLSGGILTGGIWSYETPGWGGFWNWDMVENSMLVLWLLALAAVHTGGYGSARRRIIYALFLSTLASMILTRSVSAAKLSVHSFSASKAALPLTAILVFAAGAYPALNFFAQRRSPKTQAESASLHSGLTLSAALFCATAMLVFTLNIIPLLSALFASTHVPHRSVYESLAWLFIILISLLAVYDEKLSSAGNLIMLFAALCLTFFIQLVSQLPLKNLIAALSVISALCALCLAPLLNRLQFRFLCKQNQSAAKPVSAQGFTRAARIFFFGTALGLITAFGGGLTQQVKIGASVSTSVFGENLRLADYSGGCIRIRRGIEGDSIPPKILKLHYSEKAAAAPLILHRIIDDIYITPVKYLSADELAGLSFVPRGGEFECGDKVFHLDRVDAAAGTAEFTAQNSAGHTSLLRCTRNSDGVFTCTFDAAQGPAPFELRGIDAAAALVYCAPAIHSPAPGLCIAGVSRHPLILLAWVSGFALSATILTAACAAKGSL